MVLPLPVPASVYGLVLLLAALTAGIVKLEQVKETGTYLTGIFPLLFVPAAAGQYFCHRFSVGVQYPLWGL